MPRRFTYKSRFKRRFFRFAKAPRFIYGQVGLLLLQPYQLSNNKITRFKLFLKKSSRRVDKTLRFAWFKLFPHLPLTRKVLGSRMGKGKGKFAGWIGQVPAGVYIAELKNLRFGRAKYFLRLLRSRVAAHSTIRLRYDRNVHLILRRAATIKKDVIW